jgi:hypothetical protein
MVSSVDGEDVLADDETHLGVPLVEQRLGGLTG